MECIECQQNLHRTVQIPNVRLDSSSICIGCLQLRIEQLPPSHRSALLPRQEPDNENSRQKKLSPNSRGPFIHASDIQQSINIPPSRTSVSSASPNVFTTVQQHQIQSNISPGLHLPPSLGEDGTLKKYNNFLVSPTNSTLSNFIQSEREFDMIVSPPNCHSGSFHNNQKKPQINTQSEHKGQKGFLAMKGQYQTSSAATNTATSSIHRKQSNPSMTSSIQQIISQGQLKLLTLTNSSVNPVRKQQAELHRTPLNSFLQPEPDQLRPNITHNGSKQPKDVTFFGIDQQGQTDLQAESCIKRSNSEAQQKCISISNQKLPSSKSQKNISKKQKDRLKLIQESSRSPKVNSTIAHEASASAEWTSQELTSRGQFFDSTGPTSPHSFQQQRLSLGVRMPSEIKLASQIATTNFSSLKKSMSQRSSLQEDEKRISEYLCVSSRNYGGSAAAPATQRDNYVSENRNTRSEQKDESKLRGHQISKSNDRFFEEEKNSITNQILQQINEKDSQSSTSRQQGQRNDHFITGLNWETFELIDTISSEFQRSPKRLCCPIHQDIVSLYCEKDSMLLCVSCLFDSQEHSKHTVIPLQAARSSIIANTNLFRLQVKELVANIESETRKCEGNRFLLEKSYERSIDLIQKEFQTLKNRITARQKDLEDQMTRQYESAISKYDLLIEDFKKITIASIHQQKLNQLPQNNNFKSSHNNSEIDLIVKDHFIFDRLLSILKSARMNVLEIHKSDIEIHQEDFKNLITEFGNIRFLSERQFGIKRADSQTRKAPIGAGTIGAHSNLTGVGNGSTRDKTSGNINSSRSRDVTSSNSPNRFNYVQKTLHAHFQQQSNKLKQITSTHSSPTGPQTFNQQNQTQSQATQHASSKQQASLVSKASMKSMLNAHKNSDYISNLSNHQSNNNATSDQTHIGQNSMDIASKSRDIHQKSQAFQQTSSQLYNKAFQKKSPTTYTSSKTFTNTNNLTSNLSIPQNPNVNSTNPSEHMISRTNLIEPHFKNNRSGVGYVPSNAISVYLQNKRLREQSGQSLSMN